NGKSGSINVSLTTTPGVGVIAGTGNCTTAAASCNQVIANVKPGLQEPTVPAGTLPAPVTALPNLGTSPIAGGPSAVNSPGLRIKSNFTVRIQENYSDLFKSAAQFNTGAVFPASGVLVNIAFRNIPSGLDISGCAAVLTDQSGNASAGGAAVSSSAVTASSNVLTVGFTSPVGETGVDVLWVTCTKVGIGTATFPLPSTPVTAQVFLAPTGDALSSSGSVLTGLTTGNIPRYAPPDAATTSLISFGGGITQSS